MNNSFEKLAIRLGVENQDITDYQLDQLEGLFPSGYSDRLLSQIEQATEGKHIKDLSHLDWTPIERTCRNIYFSESSGLASFYDLQLVGERCDIRVGVSRPFVDGAGQMDLAISQFDYCQTFVLFEKDGIKAVKPPQIFGAVSSVCEDWERYYGQHPDHVVPHNEFVLRLAKYVAEEVPGFNAALLHYLKDWAYKGFKQNMPGLVAVFHLSRETGSVDLELLRMLQQRLLPSRPTLENNPSHPSPSSGERSPK